MRPPTTADLAIRPQDNPFESFRHEDADGEHWLAREMWEPAGYSEWRQFENLISPAFDIISQLAGESAAQDHIGEYLKMVKVGSGAERGVKDYRLTRYGAYTVLAGSRKPDLRNYFVTMTRVGELALEQQLPAAGISDAVMMSAIEHGSSNGLSSIKVDGHLIKFYRPRARKLAAPVPQIESSPVADGWLLVGYTDTCGGNPVYAETLDSNDRRCDCGLMFYSDGSLGTHRPYWRCLTWIREPGTNNETDRGVTLHGTMYDPRPR
ncbi:MAG: hypothetical protein ACRD6W_17465 [Nitrososphaerales archaeon]